LVLTTPSDLQPSKERIESPAPRLGGAVAHREENSLAKRFGRSPDQGNGWIAFLLNKFTEGRMEEKVGKSGALA
jgi:hypothetical protein